MIGYAQTLAPAPQSTPDTIALQRAYAKQLLAGSDQPIHSWSQGLAGIVDALVGGTMARKAGEREAAGTQSANDEFIKMLTGPDAVPLGGTYSPTPAGNGMVPGAELSQAPAPPSPEPDGGMWAGALNAIAPAASGPVGAAPAVAPPAAVGAPAISGQQIAALMSNPYASPAQKAMALELWKAQHPTPAAPEPYTLKPGEHRFLGGQDIASVPEAAPEKWVDLPADANGAVYQRSEKTGELREGIKGSTPGEKWIDLPPDAQGNVRQRSEKTGEVRQVAAGDVASPAAFAQKKALAEAGRPSVTVDNSGRELPDPEKGYAWKIDPATGKVATNDQGAPIQVPIGGGSVETAAADAAKKEGAAATQKAAYSDITTQNIDDAAQLIKEHPGTTTGAVGGQVLSHIGGTPAFNVAKKLAVITANNAFDRLAKLREAGGTLGQVTTFEEKMLSDSLGSLDQAQSSDEVLKALNRVRAVYTTVVNKLITGKGGIEPGDPLAAGAEPPASAQAGTPSRAEIEAELKRRGLMK